MQNDPWAAFPQVGAPAAPRPQGGPVYGPGPKQPTELQLSAERRAEEAAARAAAAEARANSAEARAQETFENSKKGRPLSQSDYDKAKGELSQYTTLKTALETFKDDYAGNLAGGLENTAQAYLDVGTPGQRDWWAQFKAADNQIRNDLFGSALTAPEKAAYEATTVSPGMDPKQVKINLAKRAEIVRQAVARRKDFYVSNGFRQDAVDAIFQGIDLSTPISAEGQQSTNSELAGSTPAAAGERPDDIPPDAQEVVRDSSGNVVGYIGADGEFVTTFRTKERQAYDERVKQAAQGEGGYTERADQGITLGLSDEFAGVGGAFGSMLRGESPVEGYQFARDVARERYNRADQATGLAGDAVEIGSGLLLPSGSISTVQQGIRTGAKLGALGGFGYGEGLQGSTTNALIGAGLGASVGGLAAKGSNALANRAAARAEAAPARNALLQAGADEGVTVNRAMVNPELQPRVTGVSGTMVGSRTIEREMGNIGSQIEQRVTGLGGDGQALTNEVGGAKVREIAQRQIEKSGQAAKVIYDRAEKQAAGVKVTPKESMQVLDSAIADLSETAGLNSEEIKFLQSLKSDFSKDLSVGALRRARTTLRKKISKGELTFGESEARVLSIMDAAANDISSGLVAQGKEGAAKLFGEADRLYRERAQYIEGTLQKFIGKRNSTMSDQQVFTKFKSLADPKGDGPSLSKFMSELTPEERGDVAATFAAELGRNRKGDFSTAFLVDQAEKLAKNPTALRAIFGDEGARSINNLIVLAKEHNRVTNAARGSQTGVRADYRTWLTNLVFSGGAGALGTAAQGAGTGAIAAAGTAAVIGGTKFGLDRRAARALMSPKVTSWLRATPRSADPKVIDAHFKRLAAIAKAEPAIAGDVKSLQELIINAANDNQTRAVASDQEPDRVRPER